MLASSGTINKESCVDCCELADTLCTFSSATRKHYPHCFTSMQSNQHWCVWRMWATVQNALDTSQLPQLTKHSLWRNPEAKKINFCVNWSFLFALFVYKEWVVSFSSNASIVIGYENMKTELYFALQIHLPIQFQLQSCPFAPCLDEFRWDQQQMHIPDTTDNTFAV